MAKVDIKYECGCGYSTRDVDEAANHCDTKSHKITITGTVTSDIVRPPKVAVRPRTIATTTSKVSRTTKVFGSTDEFENLRSRLGKPR